MDIIVAGHICLDIIPDWQKGDISSIKPGHIVEMSGVDFSTGGAVANTGLALHKLGIDVGLLGKIGDDQFGKIILEYLEKEASPNIVDQMIISDQENTSYTIVLTPPDTDRVFLHYPGTNNTFSSKDIYYDNLNSSKLFHFGYPPLMRTMYQNNGQELTEVFRQVQKKGLVTSLDMAMPDPNTEAGRLDWEQFFKNVLPYVDIFMPSIDELLYMLSLKNSDKMFLDVNLLESISDKLLDWGCKIVVIKLGEQGLYMKTGSLDEFNEDDKKRIEELISFESWVEKQLLSPCYSTDVVGTTGSGDSTIAGFLAGVLKGMEAEDALNLATAVGACSVEAINATGGIIPLDKVASRVKEGWDRLPVKIGLPGWDLKDNHGLYSKNSPT